MKIPCTLMRGGTSKGIIIRAELLPNEPEQRDAIILKIFGSPDRRQIDGLGGADPLTSKLAIVGAPSRSDADIDYTFAQVGIEEAKVDYGGYCGNISSAVAAYGVDEGFVSVKSPITTIRIHSTNLGRLIVAEVPVEKGRAAEKGDFAIDGVPGKGACIRLDFSGTAGSTTGQLLPTGHSTDILRVSGLGDIRYSVIDIGNPMAFIEAATLGVSTNDGPDELDQKKDFLNLVEEIRREVARRIGLAREGQPVSDNLPLVGVVNRPAEYRTFSSRQLVSAETMDVWSREVFLGAIHKAYGVAETVCTAAAALIPGTVVHNVTRPETARKGRVRIGHPSGVIEAEVLVEFSKNEPIFKKVVIGRTARRILDGEVYIPEPI